MRGRMRLDNGGELAVRSGAMSFYRVLAGLMMVAAMAAGLIGCASGNTPVGCGVMLALLIPAGFLHNRGDRERNRFDHDRR